MKMRKILIFALVCLYGDLPAQTKKDPIILDKFTVDKTGKVFIKYSFIEATGVKYKIETKKSNNSWVLASEHSEYSIVATGADKIINKTDTFTLHLEKGIDKIRLLFIEPKTVNSITKTIIIH